MKSLNAQNACSGGNGLKLIDAKKKVVPAELGLHSSNSAGTTFFCKGGFIDFE